MSQPLSLLVLGGTRFVGRHLIAAALGRGHHITFFHRGQTNPGLFPEAEEVLGDRERDLSPLAGRRWDAVIDTSGYVPRVVRASAERLAGAVGLYAFVSTISVYASWAAPGVDEESPLKQPPPGSAPTEEVTSATYGWLKALCEQEVAAAFPGRALVVRPGLLVGPHDYTDRFTSWPRRLLRGGEVAAPGPPERPVQLLDARDLGAFLVHLVEAGRTGTFNAVGPAHTLTMSEMLETCRAVTGSDARLTWVPQEVLTRHGVEPPFWVPAKDIGFSTVGNARARGAGLAVRPLAETVRDLLPEAREAGRLPVPPEREADLLAALAGR